MRNIRRNLAAFTIAALWSITCAVRAHAHGGVAGPDDLGPPVITSAVLGVAGYWLMMLWPSRRSPGMDNKRNANRRTVR